MFLDGRHDELTHELRERMQDASSKFEFELAAIYRDQLHAVESVREAQRVVSVTDANQDVVGLYRQGDLAELAVMVVRAGRVVDMASFANRHVEVPDDEVIAAFLREHYGEGGSGAAHIPDEVIVPLLPEGADGVAEWLSEQRRVIADEPQRGSVQLLSPSAARVVSFWSWPSRTRSTRSKRSAGRKTTSTNAWLRVQERLRLPTMPRRIECCDISHLGGRDTVGAVVALFNGQPDKKRYRTYNVKGVAEGDDYGAMYQVLARRFRRGKAAQEAEQEALADAPQSTPTLDGEDATDPSMVTHEEAKLEKLEESERGATEREWQLPDLFVVDGGRGQLGVALVAAQDLGLHELVICGLAKERERPMAEKLVDRVYLPGQENPIPLRPNSPELFLLARARDEAHRFSNRGRSRVGKKRRFESTLENVPGVGAKTRTSLLKALGSIDAIRDASDEALLAVRGVTRRQVSALRSFFAGQLEPEADSAEPVTDASAELAATEPIANEVGDGADETSEL